MTRADIIKELNKRGYKAMPHNIMKDGAECETISIMKSDNIGIVIYMNSVIKRIQGEEKSMDEIISEIIETYEKSIFPSFNPDDFLDRDFILNHLYIALQ